MGYFELKILYLAQSAPQIGLLNVFVGKLFEIVLKNKFRKS